MAVVVKTTASFNEIERKSSKVEKVFFSSPRITINPKSPETGFRPPSLPPRKSTNSVSLIFEFRFPISQSRPWPCNLE